MAKVKLENKESLQFAKNKLHKNISFSQMKNGSVVARKWPRKRKKNNRGKS